MCTAIAALGCASEPAPSACDANFDEAAVAQVLDAQRIAWNAGDLDAFLAGSSGGTAAAERALVLIVDDDEQLREFVRVNLEMDGYVVREAGSAEEGLAALEAEPPDLVLLDVMMPQVDGFEMLRRMQDRHGVGSVPVIMFSGKVDEETASRAAREGAQAFIGKPFDPRKLLEATRQLLGS